MMEVLETVQPPEGGWGKPLPKRCPFCAAQPYWMGLVIAGEIKLHFYHPGVSTDKGCPLVGQGYPEEELGWWERRVIYE